MTSLTGKFLLASKELLDPNFARSAVLIVRHDDEGAFGLIVNRPTPVSVGKALGESIDAALTNTRAIYAGGPCEGPVFVAHADEAIGGESPLPNLFITTDRDAIETLLMANANPLKVFATYSGWSPNQLESELQEGSWLVCDASAAQVFADDQNLWSTLFSRVHLSKYLPPDRIPDDPTVN
jgi:putative transcriptional regulator